MPNEINHRVHEQELEMKIKENEILHEQLHEVSQQHQIIVQKLETRLELLENKTRNHDKTVEETTARYNRIIERMQEDRTALEVLLFCYFATILTTRCSTFTKLFYGTF